MRLLPFSPLIANGPFGRHVAYHDEGLSISVRLAICVAERERDPSGCRASGLTPELPVHVVLVPPLLVPTPSYAMVVTKKLWPTRAGHRIVQSTLLLSFFCCIGGIGSAGADVYSTDTSQRS